VGDDLVKRLEFYKSKLESGRVEWHWRLRTSNGRIVADSAESYVKLGGAKRGANSALLYKVRPDIRVDVIDVVAQ
jgi:uncharacterized protein YegP (UPF0339 family)